MNIRSTGMFDTLSSRDPLFKHRLEWYRRQMLDKLLKYKHMIVIIVALCVPTFAGLFSLIASSLLIIFKSDIPSWQSFLALLLWQSLGLIWVTMQKQAIMGGAIREYISTLPLSHWRQLAIDLRLLVIANNLLWIPLIIAIFYNGFAGVPPTSNYLLWILQFLFFILALLALQLNWLNQRYIHIFVIFAADFLAILSLHYLNTIIHSCLLIMAIAVAAYSLLSLQQTNFSKYFFSFGGWKPISNLIAPRLFPVLAIQWAILFRYSRLQTGLRLTGIILLLLCLWGILLVGNQAIQKSHFIHIILTVETLIISGFYPHLYEAHQHHHGYFTSLPLTSIFWLLKDVIFMLTITVLIGVIAISPFVYLGITPTNAATMVILQIPLCIMLYPIRNKLNRQGAVVAIVTAGLWGWLTIYLLKYFG